MKFLRLFLFAILLIGIVAPAMDPLDAEAGPRRHRKYNVRKRKKPPRVQRKKPLPKPPPPCEDLGANAFPARQEIPPNLVFDRKKDGSLDMDPRMAPKFFFTAKLISDHLRLPVMINAGYRDCARNRKIKGASKSSRHLFAQAIDLRAMKLDKTSSITDNSQITGENAKAFAEYIRDNGLHRGTIYYNLKVPHVHLDDGPKEFGAEGGKIEKYERQDNYDYNFGPR